MLGCFAIVIFIASLWFYHAVVTGNGWIKEFVFEDPLVGYLILVLGIFGYLFFVVAFCIDGIRMLFKGIPSLYNRQILILTNLSHRFNAYKVSLYMVTLLITLAVVFMGFGLSVYSYTKKTIGEFVPFDYMVETCGDINRITSQEL
ncbi:MAG TPA: hypothetical protein VEF53_01975 [Patescibacteria group bacterium]|nr:hypothetical protein [Patescibacteria group bacterium]